jgi:Protein of unknown function (Hypoth_ymh)
VAATAKQDRISRLIQQANELPSNELRAWRERARLAVSAVYGEGSDQLKRFDKIRWNLSMWSNSTPQSAFTEAERNGLLRSVELLQAVLEDLEEREKAPDLPGLAPADFHPWVADAAARLWEDGHRRQAVQAAASAVENWLRAKTNAHQGSIASLAASAFSPDEPKPGSPRLRFSGFDPVGSDGWKSAHEGAGAFGRGCFLRIRNLYAHHDGQQEEQEDLEALSSLSLLARWIDSAEVQKADLDSE